MAADGRARPTLAVLAGGARGLAIGTFVVTMAAAAYAGQNLHLLGPIGDGLATMVLVGAAIALIQLLLLIGTRLAELVLRRVSRALPRTHRLIHDRALPALRFLRGWSVASTAAIAAMLWLTPEDGPLAMFRGLRSFEILVVAGAIVGLLAGIAWKLRGILPAGRRRRVLVTAVLVPALLLGTGVGAWAVHPGMGDAIVREDPTSLTAIPQLDLPDPSRPGPHEVATATYGAGDQGPRAEFAAEADWTTPTVDASRALPARDALSAAIADFAWGFGPDALPVNGLVWYPEDLGQPAPLVLIAHGNHAARESSDPGYAYLGEHLASHGMIAVSVDENYLNGDAFFDYAGQEFGVRAWLLLRHLEQFATWNDDAAHPLAGRVDLDRVALIGHSRGGEAAAIAATLEAGDHALSGLPPVPRGFGIRAVVAIAPSDGMYHGPGAPIGLTDLDYLVLQGAHDGDLPAFSGLRTYHRVTLTGAGDHLKVALYSERANHGRFNSVWDIGDAGPLASWMLDRGSILSPAEQQQLAKAAIGAFLARSLFDETGYDAFFREPRAGRDWLPDDVVLTHWEASGRLEPAIDRRPGSDGAPVATGFDVAGGRDPMLRDRTVIGDASILLTWSGAATFDVPLEAALADRVDPGGRLTISLGLAAEGAPPDPILVLTDADGTTAEVRLSEVGAMRPLLPTRLWKLDGLGDRYMPAEKIAWPAERVLQTHAIELARFADAAPGLDLDGLTGVGVRFDGAGSVYLDDIGFEPG
jgi:dienelactone hydrolase